MYTTTPDQQILTEGTVTVSLADLLNAAEHSLAAAEAAVTDFGRVNHLGRAEAYLLIVPLILPDHLWARYRSLVERARTLTD